MFVAFALPFNLYLKVIYVYSLSMVEAILVCKSVLLDF